MATEKLQILIEANTKKLDEVSAKLTTLRESSDKTSQSTSGVFDRMFGSAGAFLKANFITGIAGQLKDLATESLKLGLALDNSFSRLKSAAKQSGQSFDSVRESAIKLSKDSILGLSKSADAISSLTKAGLDAGKSLDFSEALKKITSLSFAGEEAGAVFSDILKDLQKGEFQALEKLGGNFKSLIDNLGGSDAVMKNYAKQQELINAVISQGNSLTNDYNNFLTTAAARQQIISNSLADSGARFGQLLLQSKAVQGALGLLVSALEGLNRLLSDTRINVAELSVQYEESRARLEKLTPDTKEYNDELERQKGILEQLPDIWREYGKAAAEANQKAQGGARRPPSVGSLVVTGAKDQAQAQQALEDARKVLEAQRAKGIEDTIKNLITGKEIDTLAFARFKEAQAQLEKISKPQGGPAQTFTAKTSDFLLDDLSRTIKAIQTELKNFQESNAPRPTAGQLTEAQAKAQELQAKAIQDYAAAIQFRTDQGIRAELASITAQAESDKQRLARAKEAGADFDLAEEQRKVDTVALTEAIKTLTAAIDQTASAVFSLEKAIAEGNVGGALSAAGGLAGGLEKAVGGKTGELLGAGGAILGTAGIIVSGITGIIQREEDLAKARAQAARQEELDHRKKLRSIADRQLEIAKRVYELEKQRLDLLDQRYERQNTLLELSGKKQTAILQAQIKADEKRLAALGVQGGAKEIGQGVGILQSVFNQLSNLQSASQSGLPTAGLFATGAQSSFNKALQAGLISPTQEDAIRKAFFAVANAGSSVERDRAEVQLQRVINSVGLALDKQQTALELSTEIIQKSQELETVKFTERKADIDRFLEGLAAQGASAEEQAAAQIELYTKLANRIREELGITAQTDLGAFGLGLKDTQDIEKFNTLTSLLGSIKSATEITAENTTELTQVDERQLSFIDIGRGYIDRGVSINPDALQLDSGLGSVSLGSVETGGDQPSQLAAILAQSLSLDKTRNQILLDILEEQRRGGGLARASRQAANLAERRVG